MTQCHDVPASISHRISDGQSRGLFALIHCPTSVSLSVSPMHVHSSVFSRVSCVGFSLWSFVWLLVGRVLVLFWPFFTKETLPNTAQADLCISCMNGGSTRAKKTPGSVRSRYCDQSLQDVVRPYIARRTNQTSPSRARPNRLYMLWISWPSIFHLPPGGIEEGTRMSVAAIAHDFSAAVQTKALTWQPSAPPAQG